MVSAFRSRLIADIDGGLPYTLLAPLVYDSQVLGRTITVPLGFVTDLASVPRLLWNVLPPMGGYSDAAVVHDFLYATNGLARGQADAVLREAMEVCGVRPWQRWLIYRGVRAGGWHAWNDHRAHDTSGPQPA
jgi:hypothetical protein